MNHALNEKDHQTDCSVAAGRAAQHAHEARTFVPAVDIVEDAAEFRIVADVPGATADNVDIHFERGRLTIRAGVADRRPADGSRRLLREYGVGPFERSFEIGDAIDVQNITAEVAQGVLTVHLPRSAATQPRKIAVQAAGN